MRNATWAIRLGAIGLCGVVLAGCGGGGGAAPSGSEPDENGMVFTPAAASVDVPPGAKTQGWSVNTGTLKSTTLGSPIQILPDERQLVWAGNLSNRLMMATIKEPGQNDVTLNALSTAITLLVLHPLLIRDYLSDPEGVRVQLKLMKEVQDLAKIIEAKVAENVIALELDPIVQGGLQKALEKAYLQLHPAPSTSGKVSISSTAKGAKVEKARFDEETGNLILKAANPPSRWVAAYAETNDSVLDQTLIGADGEAELAFPSTQQDVKIRVYAGMGTGWTASDPSSKLRRALPFVLTVIDSYALPIIDIVSGWKGLQKGRALIQKRGIKGFLYQGPGSASSHWLVRWAQRILVQTGLTIDDYESSGERMAKILKLALAALGALVDNDFDILKDAAADVGMSMAYDVGAQLLTYLVPGLAQIWAVYKAATAVADIYQATIAAFKYPTLEIFDVQNLPPAASLKVRYGAMESEPDPTLFEIAATFPAEVQYKAASDFSILSYSYDFDGDGKFDQKRNGPEAVEGTYGAPGVYHPKVKVVDVDGAVTEKELLLHLYTAIPLSKEPLSDTKIKLTWVDTTSNEESFEILRGPDSSQLTPVAQVGANVIQFVDQGLLPGTAYFYRIRAVRKDGLSEWSPSVVASTPTGPKIVTSSLPSGKVGVAYEAVVETTGVVEGRYLQGTLPPGLWFNQYTGAISGTPTTVGAYSFSVEVVRSLPLGELTDTRSFSIGILSAEAAPYVAPLGVWNLIITKAIARRGYWAPVHFSGGLAPLSWSVSAGSLPPGVSLSVATDGYVTLEGTPTQASAGKIFNFTVRAVDAQGTQDERPMSITVQSNKEVPRWIRMTVYIIASPSTPPPFSLYVDGKLQASGLTYQPGGIVVERQVTPTDDGVYHVTASFNDGDFWGQEGASVQASVVVHEKYSSVDSWIISKVSGYHTLTANARSFSFEAPFVAPW